MGPTVDDGSDDASEEDSEIDPDAADDESDGDETADDSEAPDLSDVGELFVAGDLAAACKKLGIDPKILKLNAPKFKAMREGLAESKKLDAAAQTKLAEAEQKVKWSSDVIADAKRTYGPLVDLKLTLDQGDLFAAQEIFAALAPKGVTWEQLAAAKSPLTPGERALRAEMRKLQAIKDEPKKAPEAPAADLTKKNLEGATARLAKTEFAGIPGAPEAMVRIISDNWDYDRGGLKIKPEKVMELMKADPVMAGLLELKALKARKAPPAAKPVVQIRGRGVVAQGNAKEDAKARLERERKSAMAEATRIERTQTRGNGRRGLR